MDAPADDFAATLAAAQRGGVDGIERLYRSVHPRLLRYLRAEAGEAADDVGSQTWLEVVGALGSFDGDAAGFRAFVFTVARRRVADLRRGRRRRPAVLMAPGTLPADQSVPGAVEDEVLAELAADLAVRRILEVLSPDQAEIVLLRVVADLPVEEVARLVGKKPGTVRVLQHRALRRLAEALGPRGADDVM